MDSIASPTHEYMVGHHLGGTPVFSLYECTLPSGVVGILKIATEPKYNGRLDREAYILQTLQERAQQIEEKAHRLEPEKGELGYWFFFPHVVESFVSNDQGDRQVTILDLSHITERLSDLVPLEHIRSREQVRVDPKTSVWIMGKLLKLLHFAHEQGIAVSIDGENILIQRDKHIVTIFDWSESSFSDASLYLDAGNPVARAALEVISALGGDLETGALPADDQLTDTWYQELLLTLASGDFKDAGDAHTHFYALVRSVWPSKYHPFTVYPVTTTTEEIEEKE